MQDVVKKERSSNLELFRIITMLLIVAHHYVVNSGLMSEGGVVYANLWSAKSLLLLLFGAWGKTGINCFVLITGYFMCKSQITAKKFVKLFFELEFYKIVIYFVFLLAGYSTFSLKGFLKAVLPFTSIGQNFAGCYLVFFLLIPFLNILIKNMTEKQHIRVLTLLTFIFIVLGTVLGTNIQMNYVTWFVVLYLISSYVRMYPRKIFDNTRFWGIALIVVFAVASLSVVVLTYAVSNGYGGWPYMLVADSNKIFAVLTSFCGFMFFKNAKIRADHITTLQGYFGKIRLGVSPKYSIALPPDNSLNIKEL